MYFLNKDDSLQGYARMRYRVTRLIAIIIAVVGVMVFTGCSALSYYQQSISGQLDLIQKRRPIIDVMADDQTRPLIRKRLAMVQKAVAFAAKELDLQSQGSYSSYVDLGRPFVVWSVFITPRFSLTPKQWCYPVVGCIGYRSYFSEVTARIFADKMQSQGFDVYVAGTPAYSTLGWFNDPIVSSMMHWQDYDLLGTLFHELAHQKIYVKNDTVFNESFAKTVEQEALRRWMKARATPARWQAYLQDRKREAAFIQLIQQTGARLKKVYSSDLTEQNMLIQKLRLLRELRQAYFNLKITWGGYDGYDRWMLSGVNNAKIQSISTYHDYVPGFQRLLVKQGNDLAHFYQAVKKLTTLTAEQRKQFLLNQGASSSVHD